MMIKQYLTQDLSHEDKKSYIAYINGNLSSNDWVEKALLRREHLIVSLENTTCTICNDWICVRETGICTCSNGHECYDVVLQEIKKLKN